MTTRTKSKYDRVVEGAALWASYYRSNPHEFVKDYLHIELKLFQKILIIMMNWSSTAVFIGSRGIGKTFLSAIYCVVRCVLYPGTKICIASGTRGQALNVLEKIMTELVPRSAELKAEIDDKASRFNGTNAQIMFHNSSYIKVVTASDSARGNRANILLLDEFRLIRKDVIDDILRKFLTSTRMPSYSALTPQEKKAEYRKERNKIMYLSSAYIVDHWSYTKCLDTFKFMIDDTKTQFVCGLPYQLSISEGLLNEEIVYEEMLESDFNEIKFQMEYEALWWGSSDGSFFDYKNIAKNRKILYPMLPDEISTLIPGNTDIKIGMKQPGEKRILSADIALMSSTKHQNDATSIHINQLTPTKAGRFLSNIVYSENCEGMRTDEQALHIRRMFDEFDCDYIVLDCAGLGLGVYDELARDIVDSESGEIYPALSCINDDAMAARCTVVGADKVIWAVKASSRFNSDAAYQLREGLRSGRIRLLQHENEAQSMFEENVKGFNKLLPAEKLKMLLPYINTSLLVDELVNLQYEEKSGQIRLYEKSGKRKDRYSSLAYNFYVAQQLETKINRRANSSIKTEDSFIIKAPNTKGKVVSAGGKRAAGWWN